MTKPNTPSGKPNHVYLGYGKFLVLTQAGLKHAVRMSLGENYEWMKKQDLIEYGSNFFYPAIVHVGTYYTGIERARVTFSEVSKYRASLEQALKLLEENLTSAEVKNGS